MARRVSRILRNSAPIGVLLLALVALSAVHARRSCDEILAKEVAPPPHQGTSFVLYPADHISEAGNLGFCPGWVVTYAPSQKTFGTAFFVSVLGKLEARGEPVFVLQQRQHAQRELDKFQTEFARFDAAVQEGTRYSNVLAVLGSPWMTFTNHDALLEAHFDLIGVGRLPQWIVALGRRTAVTNGFTLLVSNNVVVRKRYSCVGTD